MSSIGMSPRRATVSTLQGANDPPAPSTSSAVQEVPVSALSPNASDRVFPIRSVVSVDRNAMPLSRIHPGQEAIGIDLTLDNNINTRRELARRQSGIPSCSPDTSSSASSTVRGASERGSLDETSLPRNHHHSSVFGPSLYNRWSSESIGRKNQVDAQGVSRLMSDGASITSDAGTSTDGGVSIGSQIGSMKEPEQETGLLTARFKHVVTDGGHAVITGRDGETLQRCEDEPISIPGAIQSFGLLIALKEETDRLVIRVVSENSKNIIGYSPQQLFQLKSFLDILTEEQADNLLDHLDFIREDDSADPANNGPEVFMLSIRIPQKRTQKLWCAIHINDANPDLIICEFELEDDSFNPLVPHGEGTPELPEDTIGSDPTPEEYAESTINMSRPLRTLRSARKKKGEAAAMEVFNIMSQIQEQLANAPTLEAFLRVLIGVVKELSGFHRVMIYQFDQAWNGRVVAELVDPRATKDLYKGLNFPASDIPKQARDLYKINKVRLLYDRDQETARLVCRSLEDLEKPLDMTYAYLRAMSPVHIKYLANMAVRASMSISINAFNELWGLIACHSYGAKGMRVSFPIRKMCRLVGDTASRNIERLSYASRLQARKLINTVPTAANPSGYIVASSEDLMNLFDADIGALSIRNETKIMGQTKGFLEEALALVEFLRIRKISSVLACQDINIDFPDLRYEPGLRFIAGFLFVPLSTGGNDFIVFFRKGVLREVKWAGNPYEKYVKEGTEGYLEPRKSFKMWSETIVGKCRDWSEEEIETAAVLCLVYGKFIEVWRQKEVALQNSQLTRLLLANSAHEVRTPLNAVINYLEIALEGNLDQETRENLAKSHSASKSLVYVINDLLDLTKTEEGQELVKDELFDLRVTLNEATEPFVADARRKSIDYKLEFYDALPQQVFGDQRRVRQVVSNLVVNAIQHTSSGSVKIGVWRTQPQPSANRLDVEIAIEDTGAGMSQSKVDALFRELEEVSFTDGGIERALVGSPGLSNKDTYKEDDRAGIGLGLAVVARNIRNMNGQLRLKTDEGKGSRFVIQLGFDMPDNYDELEAGNQESPFRLAPTCTQPLTPSAPDGEVMLVNRSPARRFSTMSMSRRESSDSMKSLTSKRSQTSLKSMNSGRSQKSDVNRLIDAIQEPHLKEATENDLQRKDSGGRTRTRRASAGLETSPSRQRNTRSPREVRSSFAKVPGQEKIVDSRTPIRPVRVPSEGANIESPHNRSQPRVVFELPDKLPVKEREEPLSAEQFSVLVAEDDPVNSKIVKKRLEKLGHTVHCTVNGEECSRAHGERAASYDVVLMDLQVSFSSATLDDTSDHCFRCP